MQYIYIYIPFEGHLYLEWWTLKREERRGKSKKQMMNLSFCRKNFWPYSADNNTGRTVKGEKEKKCLEVVREGREFEKERSSHESRGE